MSRIDELPKYRANLGRHVHDLSHKFGFTASVAHLLPVFHDFLNPGETVQLGFDYNLRTQPLASAAMVDLKSHVEYFFVPINLLYEPFGNMFYNINDSYSSMFPVGHTNVDQIQDHFPLLDFESFQSYVSANSGDVLGYETRINQIYRLFDMLGYNNNNLQLPPDIQDGNFNPNVFPYPLLAYNCIYQYYYRLDTREVFNQNTFNWDKFYNVSLVDNGLTNFDWFKIHYRPKSSDYFTDVKVSPILDILNTNSEALQQAQQWLSGNQEVRPQAGSELAELYTTFAQNIGGSSGSTGSADFDSAASSLFNYGEGGVSRGTLRINSSKSLIAGSAPGSETQARLENQHTHPLGNGVVGASAFNTANIRALFATEKLWSITGRARKHYDDQTLAHFGVSVPHDPKHEISIFGKDDGVIPIGEVISTSSSYDNNTGVYGGLGEIAGKGYGSLKSKIHKFTAPCHGVVMAILSFEPVLTYGNTYLKSNVLTDKNDLYNPEFDNLGMQPLFAYEGNISVTDENSLYNINGWQYRYEQWKRRFNRVSKAFQGDGSLDSWMLDFTAPQTVDAADTENYLSYLHSPSELNQIMLVNYITGEAEGWNPVRCYDGDPFVVDGFVRCKKISTMSDTSLPRLDA